MHMWKKTSIKLLLAPEEVACIQVVFPQGCNSVAKLHCG